MTKKSPTPKGTKKQARIAHPGMMGDGTEEQNLGERGNPAARIKKRKSSPLSVKSARPNSIISFPNQSVLGHLHYIRAGQTGLAGGPTKFTGSKINARYLIHPGTASEPTPGLLHRLGPRSREPGI